MRVYRTSLRARRMGKPPGVFGSLLFGADFFSMGDVGVRPAACLAGIGREVGRRTALAVGVVLLLTACAGTTRLAHRNFYSNALSRRMPYSVYLPPDFDPDRRYPLVLFLHGMGDDYKALERSGATAQLDRLIRAGEVRPFILVAPEGERGFYLNFHDGTFRYEDYIMDEVLPLARRTLPVLGDRSQTLLLGISMGGYGAINLATRHPDRFAAVAEFSAPMFGSDEIVTFMDEWWKRLIGIHRLFSDGGDRRFLARHSPYDTIRDGRVALRGLRMFLLCTEDDLDGVLPNHRRFSALLRQRGLAHEFEVVPGRHRWVDWNPHLGQALVFLLAGQP